MYYLIRNSKKTFKAELELNGDTIELVYPGKKKEDFNIELLGEYLFVNVDSHQFVAVLPVGAYKEGITASYEAGVLKIPLEFKGKKIKIE